MQDTGRDHDHVAPGEQRVGRRVAQPLDLLVDRGVLLDVGVGLGDVGLGLVVVVVGDEVLDRVVREQLAQLVGELGRQGLVGLHHQERPLHLLGHPGHGRGLAGAGRAEQDDVLLAALDALGDLRDRGRLVARRLVVGLHLERRHAALQIGDGTHVSSLRWTTDSARALDWPREPEPEHAVERVLRWARRTLLVVFGVPMAIGIAMSLVDSYRRRGKKPKPFPVTAPRHVDGRRRHDHDVHLRQGPLRRHARRPSRAPSGRSSSRPTSGRATRSASGSRPRSPRRPTAGSRSTASTTASRTSSSRPAFKRFPPSMKVLRYPVYGAGWRFFDLRRYGRDHRKILVVDDEVGFVGGYNIGSAYETEWRDTHVRITGPGVPDLRRAFADFWNLHRRRRLRASERPLLIETAERLGAAHPVPAQRAAAVDVPDPRHVPRGDQPGQHEHLDHPGLLHPRPGLRRRAQRPPRGAGSTSASWCR